VRCRNPHRTPLLKEIVLPPTERERAEAAAHIGFGNVIKILLRFEARWWLEKRMDLADLTFLLSDARIPVWWTQHTADLPVLTGWFGGPKTEAMASLGEHQLIEAGISSLAEIFGTDPKQLMRNLVAARAINWANDPLARGAYSYATPETRAAQAVLSRLDGGAIFFSGEALAAGGTWARSRRRWRAAWRRRGPLSDKRAHSSGGHSGQVSPIEPSTSSTATAALSGDTSNGALSRAMSTARWRACGSARSFIQPCSSHSRIAPASSKTDIAHPSIVRNAGRRSLVISIEISPRGTQYESLDPPAVPAANTGQGFGIVGAGGFPVVPYRGRSAAG
jgi:hypothetical protein